MLQVLESVVIIAIILQFFVIVYVALLSRLPCSRKVWYILLLPCVLMLSRRVIVLIWFQSSAILLSEVLALLISGSLLCAVIGMRKLMYRVIRSERENRRLTETLELRILERTEQLETVFKKMQKAKKQWERTFDSVPDMIMLLDTNFNIVRINKAAAEALKADPATLIGQKCYRLVHHTSGPPKFCPHLQLKMDGKSHTAHAHLGRLSGDFLITVHPLTTKRGKVIGAVHVARDVSELLRIQSQLREKRDKVLQLENAKTHDLLEVARSLNAGIAHELRTPMQSIMNTIELIQEWVTCFRGEDGGGWTETLSFSDISELLSDAETRVNYSVSVLESLSSYTKAGARKEVHLINVVPEIRTVMKTLCITDRFKCLSEDDFVLVDVGRDCLIKINGSDFMQLLINLCINALEAITHNEPKIRISVEQSNGWIEIHVIDNGVGVDPTLGDSIFVPYVSTKGDVGESNHGLGLSIVKNLVSQYGGEISYKSVPGHTDFCMTFPCAGEEQAK
jgi:PAS domain S-box-containing protein